MAHEYRTQLNIEGMTCDHCVRAVKDALERTPGVEKAEVDLSAGSATVEGAADVQVMIQAVENEGYRASLGTQSAH
jgi:copper chaperone